MGVFKKNFVILDIVSSRLILPDLWFRSDGEKEHLFKNNFLFFMYIFFVSVKLTFKWVQI